MIYSPVILDALQVLTPESWTGLVYRHMFSSYLPARANTGGARWNPKDVPAIYVSLDRETALAEAAHQMTIQPVAPKSRRTLYRIQLSLSNVLDLRRADVLARVGLTQDAISALDFSNCQSVGGAAAYLGHDGLIVPSARHADGFNMVIYAQDPITSVFEVIDNEIIDTGSL